MAATLTPADDGSMSAVALSTRINSSLSDKTPGEDTA
jgi:hypothetical protein